MEYSNEDMYNALRVLTTSAAETERLPLKMKLAIIKKFTKLYIDILIYRGGEVSQELKDQAKDETDSDSNIEEGTENK